ncbi:MarR family transcriptional regulator [Ascidiimonas meishanensis]|uniref:MarR family transcriptional regulator n=1 Tax=Ascidiimonas meishanensis TaxID=3128903 RepID=UPI0039B73A2B
MNFDPHLFILLQIIAYKPKITNNFIYTKINITQPTAKHTIKKLNNKGYLAISKNQSNNKNILLN